ncbi:MAG: hypothetical protein JSV80_14940 [Acidobacteriota bacterium]|nr:MAG: hypothetical protein JSV80_14940 [Acidobacteriota bacterium]
MSHLSYFCPILLSAVLWGTTLSSSAQPASGTLLGEWQCQYLGQDVALVFQSETDLVFDGEYAHYSLAPGTLLVFDGFEVVEYGYILQGDQLVVHMEDGVQMQCARAGQNLAARPPSQRPPTEQTGAEERTVAPALEPQSPLPISDEHVSDASWGFRFIPPSGWKWKADHSGAVLGHDTIPGMILVIPHQETDLQSVSRQLQQGLTEDDLTLSPSGQVNQKGNGLLTCEVTGVAQGHQVKGRAYGTLSPHGGGAYVLGVTTPEKYGEGIAEAADAISTSMSYFKSDTSELFRHFAGMWAHYSGGYGGGTLINYNFYPDGTFEDTSETSYNINSSSDGWGTPDTNIGATGVQSSSARWTVRGNLEAGQIIIKRPDGSERYIDYQIFVEKGRKYLREFLFDGRHFSKQKDY